jgi:membrane protease YdiL (CAAX protease family)
MLMQRFLFERKNDKRDYPLLDTKLEQWRLWALLIFISVATVLWMEMTAALDFKAYWLEIICDDLIPITLMITVVMYLSKGKLGGLFGKPRFSDFIFGIVMVLIQFWYAQFSVTQLGKLGISFGKNASSTQIENAASKSTQYFQDLFSDIFELMGEELLSLVVFLAIAALLIQYYGLGRRLGLSIALLASMFLFGMIHFQAYNWNLAQMLIVIAGERFFLTAIFLRSKTIWPSYVCHMLFDAFAFAVSLY